MTSGTDIHSLLLSIRNTIQSCINGSLSLDDVAERYRSYHQAYEKLRREKENPDTDNLVGGFLYHHNVHNFCKATVLYKSGDSDIRTVSEYGDSYLLSRIPDHVSSSMRDITANEMTDLYFGAEEEKQIKLYVYKIEKQKTQYIIAAVTASDYFQKSEFEFFCNFMAAFLFSEKEDDAPLLIDFINMITKEIVQHIKEHEEADSVIADLYVLKRVRMTFSHLGIHDIMLLSDEITTTLEHHYGSVIRVIPLSLSNYLVLYTDESTTVYKKRIDFIFNNITIPFSRFHYTIEKNNESIYAFFENLYREIS